eukprot:UN11017
MTVSFVYNLSFNLVAHIVGSKDISHVFVRNEDVNVALWLTGPSVRTFCFDVAICNAPGSIACHVQWETFEKNATWYPKEKHIDQACGSLNIPRSRR